MNTRKSNHFLVTGISCLDCAMKFEKRVQQLPMVETANLNTITGELDIVGEVRMAAIQEIGDDEGYRIRELEEGESMLNFKHDHDHDDGGKTDLYRALFAGGLWIVAWVLGYNDFTMISIGAYAIGILVGGWSNFFKGFKSLKKGQFNMAVLMSVAVIGAALMGDWEEGAAVAALFSFAEYLETWSAEKGKKTLSSLLSLAPDKALRLTDQGEEEVFSSELGIGDRIRIRPGERISSDGKVIAGRSAIDQSAITGEPIPVEKEIGDKVYAGTINGAGVLEVEVEKAAGDTTLAKVIRLVSQAQSQRAPVEQLVEKFASRYTPAVLVIAFVIAVAPPLLFGNAWEPSIYQALALLVVACPCALVISTPIAVISGITNGARNGVLIKAGAYLEEIANLDVLALDKTGTITVGKPKVTNIKAFKGTETELLALLGGLENQSEHLLAEAIVAETRKREVQLIQVEEVRAIPGRGIEGTYQGEKIRAGNDAWLIELGFVKPVGVEIAPSGTPMWVIRNDEVIGLVEVADPLRKNIPDLLEEVKSLGLRLLLLTGDRQETADELASEAGIGEVRAHLLPEDKLVIVKEFQDQNLSIGMVGDGINDSPALAASNLGIAVGSGTDTAIETADVVLMDGSLHRLPYLFRLSRATLGIIKQNITLSMGLKLLAIGAAFFGVLTLWLAILADIGATFLVTINSMRLLNKKFD
ncbi:MAG: cadmium-translocating P-type ATPase [Negativicutes bacterium]|nr:cadmium-translocating P-type ATPase [Negativicutes bacterium]